MSKWLMKFAVQRTPWRATSSNGTIFPGYICCNKGLVNYSVGDTVKPYETDQVDILNSTLKRANTADRILQIVNENYKIMNDKNSLQALRSIFELQKEGKSDLSNQKIINHPGFEKICRNLKRYSGVVELNDVIEALKILSFLRVGAKSTIVQILLQLIRKNVNSLTIPHILFVEFLLKNSETTPLVEALQMALPLVFEIHVQKKINETNAVQMSECLRFAVDNDISEDVVHFIINKLENYPGEFDGATARSILMSICCMPRNGIYEPLIKKASTDLVVDIENVSIAKMEVVLNKLAHKYTNKFEFYYQEVLFDTTANYIIDHDIGYKRALGVLRNMSRMHHVHRGLLDYVSTIVFEDSSIQKLPEDIYSIAVSFILTDYRPVHWDHLKEWIINAKDLAAQNNKVIIWIRFAAALCSLDIYKIDVIMRSLNEDYVSHLLEKRFRSNYEHYFVIWQCIKAYKPDLVQLLPTNFDPKDLIEAFSPTEFPLEGALQRGLGGEDVILTKLFSKLGVQIDHGLIFRNGVPVPLKKKVKYVEDIQLENDSDQLVLVYTLKNYHYTANTNELRGLPQKTISVLEETLKCNVIPVNLDSWKEMSESEKVPYLVQKLKEKLNLDINVLETSI